ncbi:hypothetical protein V5F63_03625 [Xanthobacter autotrophicus DSM 597]|uniref:hypothetical protein n=1 Tax=Xanthobacter wiegelii TaxID=3119913 RepID=UPI00372A5739
MSDNAKAGELNEADDSPLYADPNTPIVYVEAIANLAHGKHVAKFYLGRFDPSISGVGDSQFNASIQIVMPIDALVNFLHFSKTLSKA